jgi:hypothetical protein
VISFEYSSADLEHGLYNLLDHALGLPKSTQRKSRDYPNIRDCIDHALGLPKSTQRKSRDYPNIRDCIDRPRAWSIQSLMFG